MLRGRNDIGHPLEFGQQNAKYEIMRKTRNPMSLNNPNPPRNGHLMIANSWPAVASSDFMQQILPENVFLEMLGLERKRAERSHRKFLLLLLDAEDAASTETRAEVLNGVTRAMDAVRRDTDPAGWYQSNSILGVIFTDLGALDDTATVNRLLQRVHEALSAQLSFADLQNVHITAHIFSDKSDANASEIAADPAFYPDLFYQNKAKKAAFMVKRAMDIAGSVAALLFLSPLYLLIAVLVKLTSKGPVLFKQERLGQFGKTFVCLKFRSMKASNDVKIHQEFMKNVISGSYEGKDDGKSKRVFKMTDDPRITRVGRILRQLSLDELPQFINVLRGDMSLVGPRPPLAYEYAVYDLWHRRRVLEVKPGLTGLWQVTGRSRVSFDEMVRLDLRYARSWSLALDLRILAQTPRAVLFGDGAY
jgi:lipopolysaccharide/colanic/teichoic acid biosynthesis glycosyltransferase